MQQIIKFRLRIAAIMMLTLFTFNHCTSKQADTPKKNATNRPTISVDAENTDTEFPLPPIPVMITTPEDIMLYLSKHFWDLYDFSDTTLIAQPDITEQGFVDYIQLLNQLPFTNAEQSINTMLNKAKPHPTMYRHFATLYEKYFYDPNSPFRNEQLYAPAVKHFAELGPLPKELQETFSFQQEMLLKNKVGTTATNFAYTLANGSKKMMHDLQSNYLILFFTNPHCPSCKTTTNQLANSEVLQNIFSRNTPNKKLLTILSIYPDGNVDEWRKALPMLPQQHWVNAYDDGEVIFNKLLYDIKAIPTLYLLDKDKKVILKDVSMREMEAYFQTDLSLRSR